MAVLLKPNCALYRKKCFVLQSCTVPESHVRPTNSPRISKSLHVSRHSKQSSHNA